MNPKDIVGAKKAPLGLIPPAAMIGMAAGLAVGADKYGPFNWREQPVQVMTYVEAAYRHLAAFVDGQELAEDSRVHHIDHALAGLAILRDAIALERVVDNRPPPGPGPDMLRTMDQSVKPDNAVPRKYKAFDGSRKFPGVTRAGDGCYAYRGRHIHPTALSTDTLRAIDSDLGPEG